MSAGTQAVVHTNTDTGMPNNSMKYVKEATDSAANTYECRNSSCGPH